MEREEGKDFSCRCNLPEPSSFLLQGELERAQLRESVKALRAEAEAEEAAHVAAWQQLRTQHAAEVGGVLHCMCYLPALLVFYV